MRKTILLTCLILLNIPLLLNAQTEEIIQIQDSLHKNDIRRPPVYVPQNIELSKQELRRILDKQPSFAVYKDMFLATGTQLNNPIGKNTSDVMFQISVRQRLTKSYLPFDFFAYITYTQKAFWNLYANSAPFHDMNYNPSIGVGKYIIRDNKLKGGFFIQFEHESNGKDSIYSRSWNCISFAVKYFYNTNITLGAKAWIPYVDGDNNQDLLDYRGLATFTANFLSTNNKWWFSADLTPRKGFGNLNTTLTAAFRVSRNHNQYIYARFYNGKGDSLLDYNQYAINLRIGFCIKPDFFSIF